MGFAFSESSKFSDGTKLAWELRLQSALSDNPVQALTDFELISLALNATADSYVLDVGVKTCVEFALALGRGVIGGFAAGT
jgi:hypothetical protein